jgi:DNA-binding MarR family transcriptional regulator
VSLAKLDGQLPLSSPKLQEVSERFGDMAELPWMLASAAVMQAYKLISSRVTDVLGRVEDLSIPRYEVLGFLDRSDDGSLAVRDIKRASIIHPPTLTYILDWLEDRGLVTRKTDPADRRSVIVRITAKGRKLFARASDALSEIHYGLLGLDAEDANAVARVLSLTQTD